MKRFCIPLVICLWTWAHASQSSLLPDFDGNGTVDLPDFLLFVERFGTSRGDETYEDRFDLDGDGAIVFSDFLIFASNFGKTVPQTINTKIKFPLRAIHAAGNWGDTGDVVDKWEAAGRIGTLIPLDYIHWLKSLHINWIGLSVALHYDDSMDSTVERVYSSNVDIPTFSDDGRETQANIYQALINTIDQYPGIVNGVFYWDNWIASDEQWARYWARRRTYSIRDKPSEEIVRSAYASYIENPATPPPATPP